MCVCEYCQVTLLSHVNFIIVVHSSATQIVPKAKVDIDELEKFVLDAFSALMYDDDDDDGQVETTI